MESLEEVTTLDDLQRVPDPMGARIAISREGAGMSVGELARHLGVTPTTVTAWEANRREPRSDRLRMLSGVLNVSLTWLLEGREDQRMESGGAPTLEEVRGRVDAARALFAEGAALLDSASEALSALEAERSGETDGQV